MKPRFKANEERQKGIAKLESYLDTQPDGSILSWLEVQMATGIDMTGARKWECRGWCRVALKRVERAYTPLPDGSGIELSATTNATRIAAYRTRRIVGEARSAHRSATFTLTRHEEQLPSDEREMLRMNRSATGAIVAMSRGAAKAAIAAPKEERLPALPKGR